MARLALPLPRVDHLETQTGDMGPSVCYCLVRPLDPGARNLAANVAGNMAHTALGQFRGNSDHTRARRHFDVKRGGETQATPLAAEERRGCSKGGPRLTPQLRGDGASRLTMLATSTGSAGGCPNVATLHSKQGQGFQVAHCCEQRGLQARRARAR